MKNLLEFFSGNPWLNIIFLFLAVISIFLTFVFYYKSLRLKKPVYSSQTNRLINRNLSTLKNIEIKYIGEIVENLSVTKIAIWNSGKESIKKSDIASTDPLIIVAKKGLLIYDYDIVIQKEVNNISLLKSNENTIKLDFEFLDFNDGIVFNIYHSGKESNDIEIKGTVIGANKITKGVKKEFLNEKLDPIREILELLINHKNIFIKIIGWIITIPFGIIMFPIVIIILPIDLFYDKALNKTPTEFYIYN
jgi:hypothetical protein